MADFGCSGLPACLNGLKDEYSAPDHPNRRKPFWVVWDAVLDLVGAGGNWQPEAAKVSHSTPLPGCGASYDAGTMPVAFIYVYGRYTGLGCHPNVQGRPLGSILESGTHFFMKYSGVVSNFANSLICTDFDEERAGGIAEEEYTI